MKNGLTLGIIAVLMAIAAATQAKAKVKLKQKPPCKPPIAASSFYYLPDAKLMCGRYYEKDEKPCPRFIKQVNVQGSGRINPQTNMQAKINGKYARVPVGDCATARGAANKCLIPYVSIAAHKKYYKMNDIIEMPALRGKKLKLPNGTFFTHPGYFIVHDVGGAIEGPSRFDFFTGFMNETHPNNYFNYSGKNDDTLLCETSDCKPYKRYSLVKKENKSTAMDAIRESQSGLNMTNEYGSASGEVGLFPRKSNGGQH